LAGVTELTGCGITVKGVFVAPGKQPPAGERPLYLLIEGSTQQDVDLAKIEIKKIIQEAILHMPALEKLSGRYQVV
jgi:ATP-dependent RNA helicase DDX46/PRP5